MVIFNSYVKLPQEQNPAIGRALMFYSLHPNGRPNLSSMHGACKVRMAM
jgi:hypothetical protein